MAEVVTDDLQSFDISEDQVTQELTESSAHDSTPDISIPMSRINPALRDLTNVGRQGQGAEGKKAGNKYLISYSNIKLPCNLFF